VSHFAHFTMAHLCPLGPRDRMNCSETERSNHTWYASGPPLDTAGIYILVQWPQLVRDFPFVSCRACSLYLMVRFSLGEAMCAL
jgi:hypothetical protein